MHETKTELIYHYSLQTRAFASMNTFGRRLYTFEEKKTFDVGVDIRVYDKPHLRMRLMQ